MTTLTTPQQTIPEEGSGRSYGDLRVARLQVDAGDYVGYCTHQAFTIDANAVPVLIHDVLVNISEAWTGSVTFTIGAAIADGFMDDTQFAPTATGWKNAMGDTNEYADGFRQLYDDG